MEVNMTVMILSAFVSVMVLFFSIWVIHLKINNAGVVDVGWGIGFSIIALIYILMGEGFNLRNTLLFAMVALWGARIAVFLVRRIIFEKYEDKRYGYLREKWGDKARIRFLWFFLAQGVMQMLISIPFLVIAINTTSGPGIFEIIGFTVWMGSLWGEKISDDQLQVFKENPDNKGKVCRNGLWEHSRHPNYFFEVLCWVGLCIFALGSPHGWVGIIAPGIMLYLILYVTGIPLTEELSLKHRGEIYRQYQKNTRALIPLPRREK